MSGGAWVIEGDGSGRVGATDVAHHPSDPDHDRQRQHRQPEGQHAASGVGWWDRHRVGPGGSLCGRTQHGVTLDSRVEGGHRSHPAMGPAVASSLASLAVGVGEIAAAG